MLNYTMSLGELKFVLSTNNKKIEKIINKNFLVNPQNKKDKHNPILAKLNLVFQKNPKKIVFIKSNVKKNTFWLLFNQTFLKFKEVKILFIIKVLFQVASIKKNILLFHGASFVYNNLGYIISGPSGRGKTTSISHLIKKIILSDDCGVLRLIGKNKLVIYQSPFEKQIHGRYKLNQYFNLRNIFFIKKTSKNTYFKTPTIKNQINLINTLPLISLLKKRREEIDKQQKKHFSNNKFFQTYFQDFYYSFLLNLAKTSKVKILFYNKKTKITDYL